MEGFASLLEEALHKHQSDFKRKVESDASDLSPEDQQDLMEYAIDELDKFTETFPAILRKSLFLATYAMLEHSLLGLANILQDHLKLSLSPMDLRGDGIEVVKDYFKKVGRLPFPDQGEEWQDLVALRTIRNAIAHSDGRVSKAKQSKCDKLRRDWGTELDMHESDDKEFLEVTLGENVIGRLIQTCRTFLHEVIAVMPTEPDDAD